jgi:hypothetical protein
MTNDDLTFSSETQAIFGHIPMIPWDPPHGASSHRTEFLQPMRVGALWP